MLNKADLITLFGKHQTTNYLDVNVSLDNCTRATPNDMGGNSTERIAGKILNNGSLAAPEKSSENNPKSFVEVEDFSRLYQWF
jgi:hypothetical protein